MTGTTTSRSNITVALSALGACTVALIHHRLPSRASREGRLAQSGCRKRVQRWQWLSTSKQVRSEEHTSELQSRQYLVCRLLLEKKKDYFDALLSSAYT